MYFFINYFHKYVALCIPLDTMKETNTSIWIEELEKILR